LGNKEKFSTALPNATAVLYNSASPPSIFNGEAFLMRRREQEVGDLFVTQELIVLKLLPSNRSASRRIRWFANGAVTDHAAAAQDIATLVERLIGRSHVIRGLT